MPALAFDFLCSVFKERYRGGHMTPKSPWCPFTMFGSGWQDRPFRVSPDAVLRASGAASKVTLPFPACQGAEATLLPDPVSGWKAQCASVPSAQVSRGSRPKARASFLGRPDGIGGRHKPALTKRTQTSRILKRCNLAPPTQGGKVSAELLPSSVISIA
jgi:hypothetical protein